MSLTIPIDIALVNGAQSAEIIKSAGWNPPTRGLVSIYIDAMSMDALNELAEIISENVGKNKEYRVVKSLIRAKSGDSNFRIPALNALPELLRSYLKLHSSNGWVFHLDHNGYLEPYYVDGIRYNSGGREQKPFAYLNLRAGSLASKESTRVGSRNLSIYFERADIVGLAIEEILAKQNVYLPTQEFIDDYNKRLAKLKRIYEEGFSKQYRLLEDAIGAASSYFNRNADVGGHKVISDINPQEISWPASTVRSVLDDKKSIEMPMSTLATVYDLSLREFISVNVGDMVEYQYDKSLGDKLILPDSHRTLLDVLTSDVQELSADIIEGKSAGNIIMCQGRPGVGKTLTAEVYSELVERPMISVMSGELGTDSNNVGKRLRDLFSKSERWNAVILLDESDVFVLERGDNIEQNAIVAEFLRSMEYFSGLMFMTTNRLGAIDDAVLSRCAAIIKYDPPNAERAKQVWRVMSDNFDADLSDEFIADVVKRHKSLAPRDIKTVLRLALRLAKSKSEVLTLDHIATAVLFRGLTEEQ